MREHHGKTVEDMFNNPQQLQRIPLEKNYFWHGVLCLNENGGHTFFDVKYRKNPKPDRRNPDQSNLISLYTNDIPPFPLGTTDTLSIQFILENNMGLTTKRDCICEGKITGTQLQTALQQIESTQESVIVETENGSWQFILMEKTWVLRGVMISITDVGPDTLAAKLILNQI